MSLHCSPFDLSTSLRSSTRAYFELLIILSAYIVIFGKSHHLALFLRSNAPFLSKTRYLMAAMKITCLPSYEASFRSAYI